MQLSEFTQKGINAAGVRAVVTVCELKTAGNGKPFLAGTLMDPSGVIGFKVWENTSLMAGLMTSGNAVEIKSGVSDEYQGTVSLKITSVTALPVEEAETLVQSAPVSFEKLQAQLDEALKELQIDEAVDKLKKAGIWDKFLTVPAAKSMHHAYRHGLLQHSLEVYMHARIMAQMEKDYHDHELDSKVIGIAALFHDIGKVYEYEFNALGLCSGISEYGELLGHHYPSIRIVEKVLGKLVDARQMMMIAHCILSHHGRLEWGACVVPKTPEAIIVHLSDMASSQPIGVKDSYKPLYNY